MDKVTTSPIKFVKRTNRPQRVAVLGGLLVFFIVSHQAILKAQTPPISWSAKHVNRLMFPGLQSRELVSFTSSLNLNAVALDVVPELRPFVTVQPASFDQITAGRAYQVAITISVPRTVPPGSTSSGTIRLVYGRSTIPLPLSVTLRVEISGTSPIEPSSLVTDINGLQFPVNQLLIMLPPSANRETADGLAALVAGSIVGFASGSNTYQILVSATTAQELETKIAILQQDLRPEAVLKNFLLTFFEAESDLINLKFCDPNDNDPQTRRMQAFDRIQVEKAWRIVAGRGIVPSFVSVGIIDTDVDRGHPEFTDPTVAISPQSVLIVNPLGRFAHGTSVAGIIGANNAHLEMTCDTLHARQMTGVLAGVPNANFFLNVVGGSILTPLSLGAYIDILGSQNADVVNISAGFRNFNDRIFQSFTNMLQRHFRASPRTVFSIAAGQEGQDVTNVTPANLATEPNVITVSATHPVTDARAIFDTGPANSGRLVTMAAPGSVWAPTRTFLGERTWEFFAGTSASAPLVTAAAATVRALNPALTPLETKNILVDSGDSIATDKPIGGRRLNVCRAVLNVVGPPAPELLSPINNAVIPVAPFDSGFSYNVSFNWSDVSTASCDALIRYEIEVRNDGELFQQATVLLPSFDLTIFNPPQSDLTGWTWVVTALDPFGNQVTSAVGPSLCNHPSSSPLPTSLSARPTAPIL